jgi:ATP-dependent DNA helicase RecQ
MYHAERAMELLVAGCGRTDVGFRDGQEEAVRNLVEDAGRLLVVQKTGWGKSFVYFIATKLLRERCREVSVFSRPPRPPTPG